MKSDETTADSETLSERDRQQLLVGELSDLVLKASDLVAAGYTIETATLRITLRADHSPNITKTLDIGRGSVPYEYT